MIDTDTTTNRVTRRAALAIAAGTAINAAAIATTRATAPDPIFAAIEHHHQCNVAFCDVLHLEEQLDKAEWERQEDETGNAERAACDAMIATLPTTKAGLIALLSYVLAEFERGNQLLDDDEMLALLTTTRTALVSLPVQS
jgi:hypothetical protein